MPDTTGSSDDKLAPVTYLFGSASAKEAADAEEDGHALDARASSEPPVAWATPGVDPSLRVATPDTKARIVAFVDDAASHATGDDATDDDDADAPDTTKAHNVGLHALTRRGQSVAEMTQLLESRELEPDVVAAEIKRLKSVGLLDDFDLADTLVRTLSERKKLGKSSIASQLRQRKINPTAIEAALEQLDGDDELSRATEVAIKRAGQLSSYDQATAKRRLSAFLQRRGYSGSVLSGAMAAALGGSSSHPSNGGPSRGGPTFR